MIGRCGKVWLNMTIWQKGAISKRNHIISRMHSWLRTKISFSILKSVNMGQEDFLRVRKQEKKWGTFAWMQPSWGCDPFFTPRSWLTDSCYFVPHQKLTFVSFLSLIQDSARFKVVKNGKRWSKNSQCSQKLEKNECWG